MPQCCLYKPADERNPTATIDGIEMASQPLSPNTLTALTTKYAGRVPTDDVILRDVYATADYVEDSCLLGRLGIGHACNEYGLMFDMTLAHFAIDLTGDASTLTPTTQPPPHTFATVVYFFPSTCVGGAVTIAHGHRTTTFEALDGCFLSFYSTCDVAVAPITSGHRSFAVYYAAYILDDYDSDHSYGPTPKFAPPPLPSIQELQSAAHHFDPQGYHGVAIGLETRSLMPTFDTLMGHDKAVVDRLLAADVFDIALVRAGDNGNSKDILLLPGTFHPLCKTPALVQEVYHQTPIHEVAADINKIKSPGCCLLVWPKANRVRMLGYDRTVGLLRANVDGDVVDDLGYGSLHSIFEAAFRFFYPRPWINYTGNPEQTTLAMASLLYDHGDLRLIETFLDVHDSWADDATMVSWLLAVLRRFGASRIEYKLRTADVSISFVAQLVSLATAGDKLAQTIACDCIPVWWPRMMHHLTHGYCAKKDELGHLFDIEMYMLAQPMCMAASTHLRQHLPDVLVRKVATYLAPPLTSLLDTAQVHKCLISSLLAVVGRLAMYVALAVKRLRSGAERANCCNGHALYLALQTVGTPAFATADADVQTRRWGHKFKDECAGIDKSSLTAMQLLVLDKYIREDDEPCFNR
ncbi:hypothetical protein SPRG_13095 [Saprolegnia parasitica CBS 223.65]|uniref:Uncharacterized protein n=1 Tax=Saprolegnia parasitica (strain CBS 223.65) TaxID=695850 RepID=A0A067C5T2_SAPPC|nr:hypothetical protein SPRG_13095 [Saprolegnia parasitica CBS 223.65]KDO21911.1 hypothetical protein SPRG_13095 [Saprolegnia parasitica CBS 223.65]|eukprot:XP_012207355.1 hypothetical protein SPRG_13095 [Saprolegnia parasitica CBS 223.65]